MIGIKFLAGDLLSCNAHSLWPQAVLFIHSISLRVPTNAIKMTLIHDMVNVYLTRVELIAK
jgi:hypothetical protein